MRSQRGCLDAVGPTTRRLLGLRAGLDGRPLSRGQAASRLGISPRRAARLEHAGLRTLRLACGAHAAAAPPRVARLTRSAPVLEPASFLVPASSAPELKPAVELTKPRGSHGVESASATSRPSESGGAAAPVSAAAAFEAGGSGPGLAAILAICLATLAILGLVALRRSVAGREHPAPAAAAAAPPQQPVATYVAPPQPQQPEQPAEPPPDPSTARRAATVAATSAVGFLVRELIRRRAGRR